MSSEPLLDVRNLTISVPAASGRRANVLEDVNLSLHAGDTVGIVGESGSGKTMTSLAIMGLLPSAARVESGSILFEGEDLLTKTAREMQRMRGRKISMILQDPMTALDPSFTIGSQLEDPLSRHRKLKGAQLSSAVASSLAQVHLPSSKGRLGQYPHQLSGGMRQRLTSTIALAGEPRLLIADEPTTALDVTTQAHYLGLLRDLQQSTGVALLLVAHDLLIVRHVCQRVAVMYSRQIVEEGSTDRVFGSPQHPYTRALLDAIPAMEDTMVLKPIEGYAPDVGDEVAGCRFAARCPAARDICRTTPPQLTPRPAGSMARCWGTEHDGWLAS